MKIFHTPPPALAAILKGRPLAYAAIEPDGYVAATAEHLIRTEPAEQYTWTDILTLAWKEPHLEMTIAGSTRRVEREGISFDLIAPQILRLTLIEPTVTPQVIKERVMHSLLHSTTITMRGQAITFALRRRPADGDLVWQVTPEEGVRQAGLDDSDIGDIVAVYNQDLV